MSTKTSIKRIAAVAAVALTLGGFSAVSASATGFPGGNGIIVGYTGDGMTAGNNGTYAYSAGSALGSATLTGVAGPVNTVRVLVAAQAGDHTAGVVTASGASSPYKRAVVTVSGAGATISADDQSAATPANVVNTAGTQDIIAGNNAATIITISTPTAGTVTVNLYKESTAGSGIFSTTAAETVTITVAATATSGTLSVADSTVYDTTTGTTGSPVDATASMTSVVASSAVSTDYAVHYNVALFDALGGTVSKAVTATLSGPGLIAATGGLTRAAAGRAAVATAGTTANFYLFGDGSGGVTTVTFTVGSTTLATKTVTFYGTTVATVTATQVLKVVTTAGGTLGAGAEYTASTSKPAFVVALKDANGNLVGGKCSDVKLVSSDATFLSATPATVSAETAAAGVNGLGYCDIAITAAASTSGTSASLTAYVLGTDGVTKLSAAPVTFTSGGTTIYSVALSSDADSYAPGDKVTLTLTAKDKSGNPVADGAYQLFTAPTSGTQVLAPSAQITTDAFGGTGSIKTLAGVATSTFYAPYTSGALKLSATLPAAAPYSAALQGTTLAGSITVANPADASAQAAIDAAQEATDAANAAYDAANNAMDSADAATAAAQDAADNASAALAAVTELSATVAKLVASVSAIAASLASIKKKLGVK